MNVVERIRPYHRPEEFVEQTDRLRLLFSTGILRRRPPHLRPGEFEQILRWKLGSQYGRGVSRRAGITPELLRASSEAAFRTLHEDWQIRARLQMAALMAMPGVAAPIASAVLAMAYPKEHGVIDYRGWRQVFGRERRSFGLGHYLAYLARLRSCAEALGWSVQEVDQAVWDRDMRGKPPLAKRRN